MIAALLGWDAEETYFDDKRNGKLIESWVYQQLAAQAEATGLYEITHYRDNNGLPPTSRKGPLLELCSIRARTSSAMAKDFTLSPSRLSAKRKHYSTGSSPVSAFSTKNLIRQLCQHNFTASH